MTARLRALLEAAGVAGPEATASSMVAEMVGAVALSRAVPDAAQSTAILRYSRKALRARAGLENDA